jgi:hypothetical protein
MWLWYIDFDKKNGLGNTYLGRYFHKLVWSPCSQPLNGYYLRVARHTDRIASNLVSTLRETESQKVVLASVFFTKLSKVNFQ